MFMSFLRVALKGRESKGIFASLRPVFFSASSDTLVPD